MAYLQNIHRGDRVEAKKPNPYQSLLNQLDEAAEAAGLKLDDYVFLRYPEREISVNFPVKMDDGRIKMFTGYRVQHCSIRGPYKGGLRFHPAVDMDEVWALSGWMTFKRAVANIPTGPRADHRDPTE